MADLSLPELFAQMEKLEMFERGTAAPEDQIRAAEQQLNVRFPAPYREFLARYGWASWFGRSTYGLTLPGEKKRGHDIDTVRKTLKTRAEQLP